MLTIIIYSLTDKVCIESGFYFFFLYAFHFHISDLGRSGSSLSSLSPSHIERLFQILQSAGTERTWVVIEAHPSFLQEIPMPLELFHENEFSDFISLGSPLHGETFSFLSLWSIIDIWRVLRISAVKNPLEDFRLNQKMSTDLARRNLKSRCHEGHALSEEPRGGSLFASVQLLGVARNPWLSDGLHQSLPWRHVALFPARLLTGSSSHFVCHCVQTVLFLQRLQSLD